MRYSGVRVNVPVSSMKDNKYLFVISGVLLCWFIIYIGVTFVMSSDTFDPKIIVDWNSPQFIGKRSGYYNSIFAKHEIDEDLPDKVIKEFNDEKEDFAISHSDAELIKLYGISFLDGSLSDLAIACNTKLFDMCNKYFLASYQNEQVSPLIPMAIANIETPSRMDTSITYSALFPSKILKIDSADAISNMSCLAVMESPEIFSKLASDHWTRDRGALQMNPNYGTQYDAFNSLMGPSEAEILSNIKASDLDFSTYTAYEPRNDRTITADMWLDELSIAPGDRFNVKDSILRLASECQKDIIDYSVNYQIDNDMEIMCLLAMAHNSGSVWNPAYVNTKVGNWRSGAVAYDYCKRITSQEFQKKLKNYCLSKLEEARESSKQIPMTMDRSEARKLYEEARDAGIVLPYTSYVYEGSYYEVTYCYAIQALYSYTMLGLVYSGR